MRDRRSRLVVLASFAVLGWIHPASRCAAQTCQTFTGLTYGTYVDGGGQTRELALDLLVPSGAASPVPVVIWIHGGGWSSGSRSPLPSGVSSLCPRGYAVASIDYRLTPGARWPAQVHDAKGAVRWLRAHAATYGLDPDRFGAWGTSAGGHLAALLGTSGGVASVTVGSVTIDLEGSTGGNLGRSSRVQAVAAWYAATDFLAMQLYPASTDHNAAASAESALIGGPIQRHPERVATANPATYATADDPPFLLLHGTLDDLIPFNQSELLHEALRAHGVDAAFVPVAGAAHGFMTPAATQITHDFFDLALRPAGSARVSVAATDASAAEAGRGPGAFTVSRTGSTAAPLAVRWVPAGTAAIGTDYAAPLAVVIPAGASSAIVRVDPVQDALAEGDETVELVLTGGPASRVDAARGSATVVIADDDGGALPSVSLRASDASATETGDGGAFSISLSEAAARDLTVRYSVAGTATNGVDHAPLPGRVTIPAGELAAAVEVSPLPDILLEAAETVILTLEASADHAIGSPSTASAVIAEAEATASRPIVSMAAADPGAAEPGEPGAFLVSRTGSTVGSLTVDLAVAGSAEDGSDAAPLPDQVTFDPGVSRLLVQVAPRDDSLREGAETVALAVEPEPAIHVGPRSGGTVTLADDEVQGIAGFYTIPPCRLVDTRGPAGPAGAPPLSSGAIRVVELAGACGIPPEATALSLNVTAVAPAADGHLSLFETGGPEPSTSAVNFKAGQVRANNALVRLVGSPPSFAVRAALLAPGTVDLVVDVNGYFR